MASYSPEPGGGTLRKQSAEGTNWELTETGDLRGLRKWKGLPGSMYAVSPSPADSPSPLTPHSRRVLHVAEQRARQTQRRSSPLDAAFQNERLKGRDMHRA